MQGSSSLAASALPEAILEWLQKEMGYRPLGPYSASSSTKAHTPTPDSLRKVCRGNMIPIWNFLLTRVKSEKTVEKIRRNIHVHGDADGSVDGKEKEAVVDDKVGRKVEKKVVKGGRIRKEKEIGFEGGGERVDVREVALQERDVAEKEVERLRNMVRRQRKDLKARMLEVSREEAERKRMVDERSNYRSEYRFQYLCVTWLHC